MNLAAFMRARAIETYPEPRVSLHDDITFQQAEIVSKLIPVDGKILDVGCGQGPALEWFTKNGFDICGITTNQEDMLACLDKDYKVRLCDQNDMPPMWTETFDLVWARHVLEHSICPFFTLHEFNRVLKPGGILYAEMPAPNVDSKHELNGNHYSVLGWQMWASLIDRAGFEIVEAKQRQLVTQVGGDLYYHFTCRRGEGRTAKVPSEREAERNVT